MSDAELRGSSVSASLIVSSPKSPLTLSSSFFSLFIFKLHLHLAFLILSLTLFSSDFLSECLLCLLFCIPGWWCGFLSMVSPPFLAHLSHSPSLSSVVARLGTYPDRVCLATCTNLKLLFCPGAISPKPYAFVTPLLASWAILPCRVLAVQDSLALTRAACCMLSASVFCVCGALVLGFPHFITVPELWASCSLQLPFHSLPPVDDF